MDTRSSVGYLTRWSWPRTGNLLSRSLSNHQRLRGEPKDTLTRTAALTFDSRSTLFFRRPWGRAVMRQRDLIDHGPPAGAGSPISSEPIRLCCQKVPQTLFRAGRCRWPCRDRSSRPLSCHATRRPATLYAPALRPLLSVRRTPPRLQQDIPDCDRGLACFSLPWRPPPVTQYLLKDGWAVTRPSAWTRAESCAAYERVKYTFPPLFPGGSCQKRYHTSLKLWSLVANRPPCNTR